MTTPHDPETRMTTEPQYRYKIVGYGKEPIVRVEMVSETAHFITYIDRRHMRPTECKVKKGGDFFLTFEDARAHWEAGYRNKAESYQRLMNESLAKAGNAKVLKNPYEGAA